MIHYIPQLYKSIEENRFDPTDIITHRFPLEQAEHGYEIFDAKKDGCIKVVLKP